MANMFSDVQQKEIPKSFKDCYANDQITDNLWQWAKHLETIGKFFAIVSGIATFITGIAMIEATDGSSILICFIAAPIVAFLEYVSFHVIALLVGSLATIVQHTKITANINMLKYTQENNINNISNDNNGNNNAVIKSFINNDVQKKESSPEEITHSWRCNKCGSMISSIPCKFCGWTNNTIDEKDIWVCPECCRENKNEVTECKCGYKK